MFSECNFPCVVKANERIIIQLRWRKEFSLSADVSASFNSAELVSSAPAMMTGAL